MNPTFEPIIGSSFDNIAGQRQFWAGFNNRIDEGNIARAQAAEERRNAWLRSLADLNRQDQIRQDTADTAVQQFDINRSDRALENTERSRQFDVTAQIQREAEAEKNKWLKWHYDIADKEKKKNLGAVENMAKFIAPDVSTAGKDYDDAFDEYQTQVNNYDTARSDIEKTLPAKVAFDKRLGAFRSTSMPGAPVPPETLTAIRDANEKLGLAKADFDAAKLDYQTHMANFESMKKNAMANGLNIGKRDGKYVVYSPLHDKTFGEESKALATPPDEIHWPGMRPAPLLPGDQPMDYNDRGTAPAPDMAPDLAPAPAPVPGASAGGVRVGRFIVKPRVSTNGPVMTNSPAPAIVTGAAATNAPVEVAPPESAPAPDTGSPLQDGYAQWLAQQQQGPPAPTNAPAASSGILSDPDYLVVLQAMTNAAPDAVSSAPVTNGVPDIRGILGDPQYQPILQSMGVTNRVRRLMANPDFSSMMPPAMPTNRPPDFPGVLQGQGNRYGRILRALR